METPDVAPPMSDYKRERGKPIPGKLHSLAQTNLTIALSQFRPTYQALSELSMRLADRDVTPDISVYRKFDLDFSQNARLFAG